METDVFPTRERNALIAALKPSAVDGTSIKFSLGQQNARAGSPQSGQEGTGVTNTWNENGRLVRTFSCWTADVRHLGVCSLPSGVPLRGPGTSLDIRLLVVSIETPGSGGSESVAVGLRGPLGWDGATGPANIAAYVSLSRMVRVVSCRKQLVRPWLMSSREEARTQRQVLGACWRAPSSRPSLLPRWLFACLRFVAKVWPRFRMWCCISQQAPLALSSSGKWEDIKMDFE